jgi:hypothetical protein
MKTAIFLSLLTTACVGTITDVGPTPEPEAPSGAVVTMKVRDGAVPQAGVKVLFQNPDDSFIAEVPTDAEGNAIAEMPSGGQVTVIRTYTPDSTGMDPLDHLYTYVGVKPGDKLELVGALRSELVRVIKVKVNLDPGTPVTVSAPCGSGSGAAPIIEVQLKGCAAEAPFLVVDNTDANDPLYFSATARIEPNIDFTGEDFYGRLTTDLRVQNPMTAATVAMQKRLFQGAFTVFDTGKLPAPASAAIPELAKTQQVVSAWVTTADGRKFVTASRKPFEAVPAIMDMATNEIPTTSTPAYANGVVSWTEAGHGTVDLTIASITAGAPGREFVRSIAAPYSNTAMRVPPLPAAYAHYAIQPTDKITIQHNLARVTGGYDGVRSRVFNFALADLAPVGGVATASCFAMSTTN